MNPNLKVPSYEEHLICCLGPDGGHWTGHMIQTAGKMTRTFTKRAGETIGDGILLGTKVK